MARNTIAGIITVGDPSLVDTLAAEIVVDTETKKCDACGNEVQARVEDDEGITTCLSCMDDENVFTLRSEKVLTP